jgi:uracil-DNA glycosylase
MQSGIDPKIQSDWKSLLAGEFQKPYFFEIKKRLLQEKAQGKTIYPPGPLLFNALDRCPPNKTRVVILGQDPYHGAGQAHGLCFSVPAGIKPPPSLVNIFKELKSDLGIERKDNGNLEPWADQGVLLLNTCLSVRQGEAASHFKFGWQTFTDTIIQKLSDSQSNLVFLLWGSPARSKKPLINPTKGHLVLETVHPSPLSAHRGFLGCRHFSKANEFLISKNLHPIDWR